MAFVHLHNHTEHSSLDGLARIKSVAARAAELGQTAMAITDHGSLAGAWRFTKACKAAGIKPIIGCEVYMSIGDRFERNSEMVDRNDDTTADADDSKGETKEKRYEHLTLLARNEQGWKNLLAIHNKAEESHWYKARCDYKLLKEHGEGLIVLTGCLAGPVAGPLSRAAGEAAKATELEAREATDEAESAKLAAEAQTALARSAGFAAEARKNLDTLIDCVGKENVYLEIMYHGIDAEQSVLKPIKQLSVDLEIPMVVTNDCHYENEDDAGHHEGFLAVGSKKGLDDPARFKFNGGGYFVRSEQEMLDIKPGNESWAQACAMTQVIADRCEDQVIPAPHQRLPHYPLPEDFTDANVYLKKLVQQGAVNRYGFDTETKERIPLSTEVKERLRTELDIIAEMGFPDYFLIMWDVINWCRTDAPVEFDNADAPRKKTILVGPGRGSAAGSAVSYCLGIVGIDPLYNNLLFERFLEPGRAGMPDIDVDFEKGRRDEVFAYLGYRWGKGNVARIGTFGVALSKAAIKDAARILKPSGASAEVKAHAKAFFEAGERGKGAILLRDAEKAATERATHIMRLGNKMSDLVPASGEKASNFAQLADTKDQSGQAFRDLVEESGQDAIDILEMARAFEGIVKNESIHACGFVVSPEPLDELVPLRWASHAADADPAAPRVICWDGPEVEDYGFLKMDILGLMNLDIVSTALENIEMTTGEKLTMDDIPHPDTKGDPKVAAAFALIAAGNTGGCFQMESAGMVKIAQDVVPESLTDISAIVALFRPGPLAAKVPDRYAARKNGLEDVNYDQFTSDKTEQEWIAKVLDDTFATFVFQEQLMRLGTVIAGFDASQRSVLRKAVGKKDAKKMAEVGEMLAAGAEQEFFDEDGVMISPKFSAKTAAHMFELMKGSASYLFNACLTGDSVLHGDRGARWTIEDLYNRLHGDPNTPEGICPNCQERSSRPKVAMCARCDSWLFKFRDDRGFNLLAFDHSDGRIRPQRVKDVHRNGTRPVFRITLEDGKTVRATGNHRFLTPAGYVHVDDLSAGMELVTNAGYQKQPSNYPERRTTSGARASVPGNKPWLPGDKNSGYVDGGFIQLKEWTEQTIVTASCDQCGRTHQDGRLERAHLDGNRLNNDPSNLAWKCPSHHKAYDYATNGRLRRWEKGHQTAPVRIVSIVPDGVELVYDVEMDEGTDHNFVVNGILSHNSHSAAYAQLAFVTAYLKANWPVDYAAAILAIADKDDKRMNAFWSLKTDGITVLAPDINLSLARTAPVNGSVQMGLAEVKEVGVAGHYIVAEREKNGEFKNLHDVLTRVTVPGKNGAEPTKLPVGAIQGLIEAGALDCFGPRLGLLMTLRAAHKTDLTPVDAEWSDVEESTRQRQRLGVSLGTHPLQSLKDEILAFAGPAGGKVTPLHKIADENGEAVLTVGVISMWEEKGYSGGRRANFALESSKVTIQGVMWDRTLSSLRRRDAVPKVGDVVAVTGKVNVRTTSVGDDEAEAQETITTKELSIFEVWPIASATAPEINEPPAVIDFAAKYRELRDFNPAPDKPTSTDDATDAAAEADTAGAVPDNVLQFPDQGKKQEDKKATASWCAVETDEFGAGVNGITVAGDDDVRKKHLNAIFPTKTVKAGSIYKVNCIGGDVITVLIASPSLNGLQLLEIAGKVDEQDPRWQKVAGQDPDYTWYLLAEAGQGAVNVRGSRAA